MKKKPYCRIEYVNCEWLIDYQYTVCPWNMVASQINTIESAFTDAGKKDKPEIKITVAWLTDKQWEKEFAKWDK